MKIYTGILWFTSVLLLQNSCKEPSQQDNQKNGTDSIKTYTITLPDTITIIDVEDFDNLVKLYEDPDRLNWQNPDVILQKMDGLHGATVADIGTGTGYFAFRLVRHGAKVIGTDIEKKFLDYIEERKSELPGNLADNIETRLTPENDPLLAEYETDWVLIVNTYHFLQNRVDYLKKLKKGLKPGGKLLVVDYKIGDMPVGPDDRTKVPINTCKAEIQAAGFRIIQTDNSSLQYQYIISAIRKEQ